MLRVHESKTDSVLISIDQSLAYNIVSHEILIKQMKYLSFSHNSVNLLKDYLSECSQLVHINGADTPQELPGPIFVSQRSVLSCLFFIVFTINFSEIFHSVRHTPEEYSHCKESTMTAFIDDAQVLVEKTNQSLQSKLEDDNRKLQ